MSRRYMYAVVFTLVAVLLSWLGGAPAQADSPGTSEGTVKTNICSVTTLGRTYPIDSTTGKVAKAAASAATNTDAVRLYKSEQHSVGVTVLATQTVSLTVTAQGSWDGTNFIGFTPAVAQTFSLSSTTTRGIAALSLPVIPYARFTLSSDATYPVTYQAVVLNAW